MTESVGSLAFMELKKTILIIEDDPAQQDIYAISLQKAGFSTVARGDAMAGLRWLEQILPDLIVLDVMLPHISGVEMLHEIRQRPNGATVPIIIATASATLTEEELEPYNVAAFLRKPLLPRQLLLTVEKIFARNGEPSQPG